MSAIQFLDTDDGVTEIEYDGRIVGGLEIHKAKWVVTYGLGMGFVRSFETETAARAWIDSNIDEIAACEEFDHVQ